ncbi:hypothetical protein ACQVTW_31165 [Bacillus mycoides]
MFDHLNYSPKKIAAILTILLKSNLNTKILAFNLYGPCFLILRGYKIKLSGRLDDQKNQMAKHFTLKKGSLTLTNLNSYVDYKNINLNTKLGVCNIKI